jgi:16S rRNA A1518/A1519 N6-dimethyltransferase RsmA/KsgA/DIM1 with predicted DNA glycosylase/AP lyase activity
MINKKFKLLFNKNEYIAEKLNINLSQRPEELSCENFYNIAAEYEKLIN